MAHATVDGRRHAVRVTQDLTDNYAVEVYPEPEPEAIKESEPYKNWPVPLAMKVMADSREDALACALEHMKKLGKISDYHLEESEKPKPKPTKPAGAPAAE
ncbi:MAG: hypothetical protein HYZ28_18880 [Myxococcales bacterium]|nr:hypothetical protein [Myxococcales bacterium]